MSHKLDPHYSDFGGVDTRSNPLSQNPKSARIGSKNFRWNYEDQLQQREGFQHKTSQGQACEAGLIEYKFKDINTGESKTEILGVSFDGFLRKRIGNHLKISVTAACTIRYYSLYYDSTGSTFKIVFLSSAKAILNSINISLSMTLDQLNTAINGLSVTGLSSDIVDDDGASISSSLLAYLLDVTFEHEFNDTITDIVLNPVYDWLLINTPDGNAPFTTAIAHEDDPDYEGISYVNSNQACYITDGGFPFKYDGKAIYRAGLPGLRTRNGFTLVSSANAGGWSLGDHVAKFQLRYKDINGVRILGQYSDSTASWTSSVGNNYTDILVPRIQNESKFPIYACKLTAGGTMSTGSNVLSVSSGHNIKVGQCIRFEELLNGAVSRVYYFEVTAVGATSVTIDVPATASALTPTVISGQVLNGCYVPDIYIGKRDESVAYGNSNAIDVYGPYYVMLATHADVDQTGTFYEAAIFPVPVVSADEITYSFGIPDGSLVIQFDSITEAGSSLPRACKYLNVWQEQVIQAGRPYDAIDLAQDYYPTINDPAGFLTVSNYTVTAENLVRYTEVHMADFQSVYWEDFNFPEGFPQSGLNEESFENNFNDSITGIMPNKEALFCFKNRTTAYLTGTLATGDIVKEFLEADIGAATQGCIQEVRGSILFMDENLGFWSVVAGRLPTFLGYPLLQIFKENSKQPNLSQLNFKKAKSTNFRAEDQYICYVPADAEGDPSSSSMMFVYDYASTDKGMRNSWYIWQDINAAGGILATADDDLLISQKQSSNNRLWKQKFGADIYVISDHNLPIEFNYKGAFLTYGKPIIDKDWVRCVINSISGGFNLTVQQYANFIDTVISDYILTFPSGVKMGVKLDVKAAQPKLSGVSWGFYNNTIHQLIKIDGWEVEFSASFDVGESKR